MDGEDPGGTPEDDARGGGCGGVGFGWIDEGVFGWIIAFQLIVNMVMYQEVAIKMFYW
jgi:hypothetical protein